MTATIDEIRTAHEAGDVTILPREVPWIDMLAEQAESLPKCEDTLIAEMLESSQRRPSSLISMACSPLPWADENVFIQAVLAI